MTHKRSCNGVENYYYYKNYYINLASRKKYTIFKNNHIQI